MAVNCNEISTFRRLLPQVLVAIIQNLITLNKTLFDGLGALVIPALLGISTTLNPDETIRITGAEASWLSSLTNIGHPFGSFLSGFLSDALGRRRAMMLVMTPAIGIFIMLGMAKSFWTICLAFLLLSFVFGLKDAPSSIYVSEVSEKSLRGVLLSFCTIAGSCGYFVLFLFGNFLSWRQLTMVISAVPAVIIISIYFIPETPNWLLLKDRPKDAQKSLQWLRGWVRPEVVEDEFTKLKTHNTISMACTLCTEHSTPCQHSKMAKFFDQIKELKQKHILKPFILVTALNFFLEFNIVYVWRSYIVQVVNAFGIPLKNANFTVIIFSSVTLVSTCCFLFNVKVFGKRRMYLFSGTMSVVCCVALSIYGFIWLPPNWISFNDPVDSAVPDFDRIRNSVGNYGYVPMALIISILFFSTAFGFITIPIVMTSELFPSKLRSFLSGLAYTIRFSFAAIASKTYYNLELWLTLPGATLFYAMISLIGLIAMYFILPETEKRSLEDIEAHYADDTKKITDIQIPMNVKSNAK